MEKTIKDALLFEKTKNGLTQQMMIQILLFICVPVFSALVLLLFSATYFAANDPHHSVEVYGAFAVIMLRGASILLCAAPPFLISHFSFLIQARLSFVAKIAPAVSPSPSRLVWKRPSKTPFFSRRRRTG